MSRFRKPAFSKLKNKNTPRIHHFAQIFELSIGSLKPCAYSCFDKGCPTQKHQHDQSVRDNTERHDGCGCSLLHRFQRDGRHCYEYLFACVKRNKIDSELIKIY